MIEYPGLKTRWLLQENSLPSLEKKAQSEEKREKNKKIKKILQ